jgi:glutaredoxin
MNIVVYTKRACPRSLSAKVWLTQHGYPFKEIDVSNDAAKTKTPEIIIEGVNIGGFSELLRYCFPCILDK